MKAAVWFLVVTLAIVGVSGVLLGPLFSTPADRAAVRASAVVAVVVQAVAFAVARRMGTERFIRGWVIGVALRFATVIVYGAVAVRGLGHPAPATLISLVTFLFLTTLAEPKLLTL